MEFVKIATKNKDTLSNYVLVMVVIYLIFIGMLVKFSGSPVSGPPLSELKRISGVKDYKLNQAMGLAVDEKGNIYIADNVNDRIVVFNKKGYGKEILGVSKLANKKKVAVVDAPTSIAVLKNKLYVGSFATKSLVVLDKEGKKLDTLPHKEDRLVLPAIQALAMTTDQAGNLYVADGLSQQITVFTPEGRVKMTFGRPGYNLGELSYVNGLVVDDTNRRIMALDSNNLRLVVFNLEGKFLYQLPLNQRQKNLFLAPRGLAYNSEKKIFYITDTLLDKVVAIDETGKVVAQTTDIKFSFPHGVFLGPDKVLYVTNRDNSEVYLLNS